MLQQLIRKCNSGNNIGDILRVIFRVTKLNKNQRYITTSSSARVLPDNIQIEESHQLETENTLTIDDDNLMNQQEYSEPDNDETSSSDDWKFLFEVVIEDDKDDNNDENNSNNNNNNNNNDNNKENNKKQELFTSISSIKQQSLRSDFNQKIQNQFISDEKDKDAFRRIFRTLLDNQIHDQLKDSKLKEKSKSRQKLLTIEKHLIDLMKRSGEQKLKQEKEKEKEKENKWVKEHYENSIPNDSNIMNTKSSSSNLSNETKSSIKISDELLLKCETKKQLLDFISKNIFGIGSDKKFSSDSKLLLDDFNRPFPFKYAKLLKQSILVCKKFKDPYLALSIFEQTKRRGLLSYQLGCTTEVYNQIILIRWEFWKDLKGIENLLNEMIDNEISFNKETSDIIDSVELEVISFNNLKRWDSFDRKSYNNIINLFENKRKKFQSLY
ncbi:hypothetical protein RclHR1_00630032 [Rhizophagus clarus]|uniref:Mtf2-like C-terminal domain-containing protein n=1 Tax=Rhizophagus clarus TaxID=94130 RepID=A0A2Z6S3Y3_9GLOM|nr:hypothetical protein RclHR1_00630032 [Rhizophagus clarus]GES89765.1 hypothetical protein RCL_jg12619.t1 [Rhizophagus clarus]